MAELDPASEDGESVLRAPSGRTERSSLMRAVVVYESMYGNTRQIAEAVSAGLQTAGAEVALHRVADRPALDDVDLLVVGGPTHAWSLSRDSTRRAAAQAVTKPGSGLHLEPEAAGSGLREWLAASTVNVPVAVGFDTRIRAPWLVTGRASRAIARRLRERQVPRVLPARSFFVRRDNTMVDGETARAHAWGAELANVAASSARG